jgi:uncharacterized membrane protein YjjP (DUF1212 family)
MTDPNSPITPDPDINASPRIAASLPAQFPYSDGHPHKPPMTRDEMRDVANLSLWAGQMLLQYGADSARVEQTVHRLATGLGCDWADIEVQPSTLIATMMNNQDFRTRVRRAPSRGVNMAVIAEVSDLSYRVFQGEFDRIGVRQELRRIDSLAPQYDRWIVIVSVGVACAAFCQLFGGDLGATLVTGIAASIAMFVRQELHHRHFNPLVITTITAFVAGIVSSLAWILPVSATPELAVAASALLLVPGVPLINAAEDLLRGHLITGLARGFYGILVALAIALGLSVAIWVTGGKGL